MSFFLFLLLATFVFSFADEIDINGDFEKCAASSTGIILPEGWMVNQGASKNAEAYITRESDSVRNGSFALQIEVEEGGSIYLMRYQTRLEVRAGARVDFSVWCGGRGKLALGFIQNGENGVFLGTVMKPGKEIVSKEDWTCHQFEYVVDKWKKDNVEYESFILHPVIYVQDKADMLLDDLKLNIVATERIEDK